MVELADAADGDQFGARSSIAPAVVAADLGPPTLVRRNAVVVMLYSDRGLGIRTEGRALDSGGAGEVVRVINLTSRQPVLATVTGENQVEVHR